MDAQEKIISLNLICRTCLCSNINLKPIFDDGIADKIIHCKFLEVLDTDGYPNKICLQCQELVLQSYSFKQLCEKSNTTLAKYTHNPNKFVDELGNGWIESTSNVENSNDTFTCNTCDEIYNTETDLLLHQNSHIKKIHEKHLCSHCNKNFSSPQHLKRHMNVHLKKIITCKCGGKFISPIEFSKHAEECEKKDEVIKDNINRNMQGEELSHLTSFLEESNPPLLYACTTCSQSFDGEYDLKLHISTHVLTHAGEYICSLKQCKKKFGTRQMLQRHIKTHMINKPHLCRVCGKGFAESHALTKHSRVHTGKPRDKKHICNICGQGFCEPFYLNVHVRKHTGERPLMCSACGKSFADPRSLKAHNMTHTGEKPYQCHICSKAFSQNVNLVKHLRVHTGEKPYICTQCGKSFSQSSSLNKHVKIHAGVRPYACNKCPKRFSEKATLIQHSRTHTGEKPYVCAECGQTFATASELKLHDRKHSGLKKNVCNICGKDFATPNNLLIHSRSHSGEKPYSCEICRRPFSDKGALKKHAKMHKNGENAVQKTENYPQISQQVHVHLNNELNNFDSIIEPKIDVIETVYFDLP